MIFKSYQNTYCKNFLKYWGKFCPNNCEKLNYVENKGVIDKLCKLKSECPNCDKHIKSEDIKSHLDSNCIKISKKQKNLFEEFKKKTLQKLSNEEVQKMRNEGKKISYLSSKEK